MGIKPKGTEYIVVPPDNPTSRWGEWEASLDGAGDTAGEVFAETHAIATSAKSTAELAVQRAQGYITAAENATAELTAEIDPEHPDYLLWSLATQVDKATQQALRAHSEAISANDIAVQALTRTAANMFVIRYGQSYTGEHFIASWDGNVITIAKRYNWVGDVTNVEFGEWAPTQQSQQYTWSGDHTILYQLKTGTPESRSIDSPELRTLANDAWVTLAQWVVPNDTQVSASGSFVWANKAHLGDYYARLTLDGVPVTTGEVSSGAPIFGHGARTHQVSMRLRSASRNAVLRLQARAVHPLALNRQVRDVNLTVHWVGQEGDDVETVAITGTSGAESMEQFRQALEDRGLHYSTVTEVPFNLDTSGATDLALMFLGCASLTTAPEMDTSSVTTTQGMFQNCGALVTIPEIDTSNVIDMFSMFSSCSSLTSVPDLDTANVTDARFMFSNCSSLTDGSVRLIGKNAAVNTFDMITGSGLTRLPFFNAAGNPI